MRPYKIVALVALGVFAAWMFSTRAAAAVQTKPIVFKPDAIEKRIDCLIFYLKNEKHIKIPHDLKEKIGLERLLEEIGEQGLPVQAENQERALNEAVEKVLKKLLGESGLQSEYLRLLELLLAEVNNLPSGYCEPEAYEPPGELRLAGRGVYDPRERYKDEPTPEEGNFIFYGKNYTIPDETVVSGNGLIRFSNEDMPFPGEGLPSTYPPAVAPLWMDQGAINSPTVTPTTEFVRYAYDLGENGEFSTTLFKNPQSKESDWIVLSYGDIDAAGLGAGQIFVGLIPGDGRKGHPGEGIGRGIAYRSGETGAFPVDLSREVGASFDDQGGNYLWIGELFSLDGFDLQDHFLIFRPDGDNKYTVTAGTRDLVVDSLGMDGEETTLDLVVTSLTDPGLLASVDGGDYLPGNWETGNPDPDEQFPGIEDWPLSWSGNYKYGIQTVGSDQDGNPVVFSSQKVIEPATGETALDRINASGLLAYAVQAEEDRLNREIIDMAKNTDALRIRAENIRDQLQCSSIRARDALFTQVADAQAGRVTKDREGNWVRTQQYILRPDPKTVQVLNVTLRGKDAGKLAGLSTMEFTTTFKDDFDPNVHGPLKELPWNEWLRTVELGDPQAPERMVITSRDDIPELENMYVKFTNPQEEFLKEERAFGERDKMEGPYDYYYQMIEAELLTVNALGYGERTFTYNAAGSVGPGEYGITSVAGGFAYLFDGKTIDVTFYEVDDTGEQPVELTDQKVDDIWDALRTNLPDGPEIGQRNLEITIDARGELFSAPLDVVYVPMSRMLWKKSLPEPK